MARNPLDASGRQHAAGTWPNHATASVDAGCNRTVRCFDHSFA
ncbi:hypothetical protein BCCR75502_04436 [Burkholderia sola]|nr:hypothetical protein BCCR75389_04416 [Burkholderia cenocepacia]CAG2327274.1 hypothetical protein BCCR75384_04434 [Burkholderia cenocepacia]CAG2327279.1 hypothetical protein BCCR75386_04433 [Burkholderia cenocepacia]CAG2327281.1 hypothetical protein BCCR75388_04435 [Burkholderia cenocepacia]CAG2327329.1 hypothetical protein BCCR75387_04434 [Burkholderia cenocepacia]